MCLSLSLFQIFKNFGFKFQLISRGFRQIKMEYGRFHLCQSVLNIAY